MSANPTNPTDESPIRAGVFDTVAEAEQVVDTLLQNGFTKEEITVFCPDKNCKGHFDSQEQPPSETGLPKDHILAGSTLGGTLGGVGAVAGLATMGGIPIIVAGGMAGLLAGGVAGGLIGAMTNRGVAKEPADYFDQAVEKGKILVAIEPAESDDHPRLQRAQQILTDAGAQSIPLSEG